MSETTISAAPVRRPGRPGLFLQVVVASVLGLALGVFAPGLALETRWTTDLFLRLIVMAVGPLLFCIVVMGIVGAGSLRTVGRLGAKALLYFEVMTTLVLVISVGIALAVQPGRGIVFMPTADDAHMVSSYARNGHLLHEGGVTAFLLSLVPRSPVDAFAQGNVLQILFFAILFGCCVSQMGEAGAPLVRLTEALSALFSRMMRFIIMLAPLGVFGAMAMTTARYGLDAIGHLAAFVALYFLVIALFVVGGLGTCLRLSGVSPVGFLRYFREELAITFATTASDSVLPSVMAKLEHMGVDRQVVGLVVPAGYSFNLDALSIYLGLAVIFLAQATGTHLTVWQIVIMLATALLTSKGAHGVPGIAIVVLAATLAAIPSIPPASLVMLLAVDWFIGIARAVGNLAGNCVAPVVIGAWEGRLDRKRAAEVLGRS
ncbi:cation:dicarboxylase symporter family transporter [Gluconacetobacter azotocaptans]|uniref:Cation:dicarboxylase symporter family transporter n=1 Tax=Gluconacetobacter azotocaptans TaxID=142834 RepID=A0A7W4PIB0_9PROT|nr:cation:dicarboxylase symporter family transporter [Gluconacetobacter azotocaptans]MBB2191941.1 cation:dicarboxylase symporter family transporter [Gluconacetobacter azotocaptans]GBQ37531.1 C4-dicarboxylate transport protein [Gluconacetobacter azotocaptans DSM 13594]